MELRNIERSDLPLYEAIHCDLEMMADLGGPLPREGMGEKLLRDVGTTESGETWVLKIIPDPEDGRAAGTIAVWDHVVDGETITEIGWMILPEFQGQGLGSAAVRAVLDRARAEGRWSVIHAYPPVTNPRSNAMCRKMGFSMVEEREYVYRGRHLRCNHWRLDLRSSPG
jgi:RimJ/RimL family protein N-acetyltransferase